MPSRVCSRPGCGTLVSRAGLCPPCRSQADRARGTTTERGYGAAHTRLRATYQARMDAGERFTCWRCSRPVDPSRWHLGHNDARTGYEGPECVTCNLSAAGRAAHRTET